MLYLESTSYWVPGARCAFESVGADHFVFGTDSPPPFVLKKEDVELIEKMGLLAADKNKVRDARGQTLGDVKVTGASYPRRLEGKSEVAAQPWVAEQDQEGLFAGRNKQFAALRLACGARTGSLVCPRREIL